MREKPINGTRGAQFDENDQLTTHNITGNLCWEMPFKGAICGSCFVKAEELRVHLLSHTGKKLKCDVCGLCFVGWKRTHPGMRFSV